MTAAHHHEEARLTPGVRWLLYLRQPLYVPRWLLMVKYFGFTLLGAFAFVYGIPTLQLTTGGQYTVWWASVMLVCGAVAMIASTRETWEVTERWAAVGITSLLSAYAGGGIWLAFTAPDLTSAAGRAAFAVVLVIITLLPGSRAAWLLTRIGRRHRHRGRCA